MVRRMCFDAIDPSLSLESHIASERHLFSIKMKENNQKVEIKVSGRVRVRVGVGRDFVPIRWHPFNNLNSNYNLHSIAYVIIAYSL